MGPLPFEVSRAERYEDYLEALHLTRGDDDIEQTFVSHDNL